MTLNARQREVINEQLRTGQFVEVFHEGRVLPGSGKWKLRDQLHADEVGRQQRIMDALPKSDKQLIVALDASNGLYSALELFNPIPALDFEGGTHGPADPKVAAQQLAAETERRTHLTHEWTKQAIERIGQGKIKHFEDLKKAVPSDVDFAVARKMLAQATKSPVNLRSKQGVVELGGYELELKKMPYAATHRVRVDVREIDEDAKPNGAIQFKVDLKQLKDPKTPDVLRTSEKLRATLATGSDAKTLAVLHYAKFCQASIELELALAYLIPEDRTELTVTRIVNDADILSSPLKPGEVMKDLF